jgi:hypothetical protein
MNKLVCFALGKNDHLIIPIFASICQSPSVCVISLRICLNCFTGKNSPAYFYSGVSCEYKRFYKTASCKKVE